MFTRSMGAAASTQRMCLDRTCGDRTGAPTRQRASGVGRRSTNFCAAGPGARRNPWRHHRSREGRTLSRIFIVGSGVVGEATGRGLLHRGHKVTFVDVLPSRVETLRAAGLDATDALDLAGE